MSSSPPGLLEVSMEPSEAIEAFKEGVDRTLLRENLRLTTAQRVTKMISVAAFAEELRRSARRPERS